MYIPCCMMPSRDDVVYMRGCMMHMGMGALCLQKQVATVAEYLPSHTPPVRVPLGGVATGVWCVMSLAHLHV